MMEISGYIFKCLQEIPVLLLTFSPLELIEERTAHKQMGYIYSRFRAVN
jgi:hypothetical protein